MIIVLMILIFGALIFIHEFGHFFVARKCGITVREFAIGMGPTLFSRTSKKSGTKYSLKALPIGGFVSMLGEDEESDDQGAFCNKKVWKRILVVVAGAVMNILLGFILMSIVVLLQGPIGSTVVAKFDDGALSNKQLCVNDEILKIGNTRVHTANEVMYEIFYQGEEPVDVTVRRNGETLHLTNVEFPCIEKQGTLFGEMDFKVFPEKRSFVNIVGQTFHRSVSCVKMVYDSLLGLITGRFGIESVSGPIGVTSVMKDAANTSAASLIYLVAMLTINLGVVNLLPFPALDGGRLWFLIIEGIRRKPINRNVEAYINFVGIIILFAFMIFISAKDILKLIIK